MEVSLCTNDAGCNLVQGNVIGEDLTIGKQFELEIEIKLNGVKNEWTNLWAFQVLQKQTFIFV